MQRETRVKRLEVFPDRSVQVHYRTTYHQGGKLVDIKYSSKLLRPGDVVEDELVHLVVRDLWMIEERMQSSVLGKMMPRHSEAEPVQAKPKGSLPPVPDIVISRGGPRTAPKGTLYHHRGKDSR